MPTNPQDILQLNRRAFLQTAGAAFAGLSVAPNVLAQPVTRNDKIRGIMVDAARVPEDLSYYRRVIDFCSEWQLNTVQFRLTDDQGTALRFSSVPNLITHPHAFTPDELHALAEYGRGRGVDLLPEIEAFGHTGYITRSPDYKHLLDDDPSGSAEFTGIIPVHPETLPLFEKLFREVAAIFPSKYLHGGCDEVNWGGSALSRKALANRSRPQIWGDYLNLLNKLTGSLGKTFIVWGDLVLGKEPEILAHLDKNIVIMDWNYWDTDAHKFSDALAKVHANGSRGIGAPGLISYRWGPRPGVSQLANIDAFADAYLSDPASLGVILTNWVPSRYIQNSLWDGFAYAAVAFNDGAAAARSSAFQRFVEKHYGAKWNDTWAKAFTLLYDAAPLYGDHAEKQTPLGLHLPVPFSDEKQLRALLEPEALAVLNDSSHPANQFPHLRDLLTKVQPTVTNNKDDFRALLLSVTYLDALFWRQNVIQESAKKPLDSNAARKLIRGIADRDHAVLVALMKDWDSGRPSDSPAKLAPLYGMAPKDQLVYQWSRAAAFSANLAQYPVQFEDLLKSAGLGRVGPEYADGRDIGQR